MEYAYDPRRRRVTELRAKLQALEELAGRLGIEVRYVPLAECGTSSAGGRCRLRSQDLVLIDGGAPAAEKIGVLLDVLGALDLEDTWVPPAIRRDIERRAAGRSSGSDGE